MDNLTSCYTAITQGGISVVVRFIQIQEHMNEYGRKCPKTKRIETCTKHLRCCIGLIDLEFYSNARDISSSNHDFY